MKRITLFMLLAGGILAAAKVSAQKVSSNKVPAVVIAGLAKKYPGASKVTWEKEKGNFEANWGGKSGEDMSVQFTPAGDFIEEVHAIQPALLPSGVNSYVKLHYKNAKITEAGKVTDAAGKTSYEAEVKGKDILFDESGNFVKIETE